MKMWLYPLWIIIDLLLIVSSIALWIAIPEMKTLNISLSVFIISLTGVLIFIRWDELKNLVKTSFFKHAPYQVLNVFLILSILGIVNFLGYKNFIEFDLTKDKKNSLTDQTFKVLDMIKAPLELTLYAKREEWEPMLRLLKLFQAKNKKIKISAIDTDLRPDLVKANNINQNGTVLVNYNNKKLSFILVDELSVTNSLLKVIREKNIVLYMTKGHQELSCNEKNQEGISEICEKLKSQNYDIKELDLATTTSVPSDATAILILGPVNGYLESEAKQIKAFLDRGGSLILALAPVFKNTIYENLIKLAEPYGLKMGKDIIVDRLSTVQGAEATIPIVSNYDSGHMITEGFQQRTVYPLSSSISTFAGNDSATIIAKSTPFPGSWAETDLAAISKGKAEFKEGVDMKGPVGLIGLGEKVGVNSSSSRLVLMGSSSFLINAYQSQSGNTALFLNIVSWVANDEGIISFNRAGTEEMPVILSNIHLQMIFVISILIIPIIFFGTAIFIYRRRRLL
jgi:ABC-type uncharacterized transport system involved in gliding motility auxiliary subunit